MKCQTCGNEIKGGSKFCSACGAPVKSDGPEGTFIPEKKTKSKKKFVVIGGIAIFCLAVVSVLFIKFIIQKDGFEDNILYFKDNMLLRVNVADEDAKTQTISRRLAYVVTGQNWTLPEYIKYSEDRKYLFYAEGDRNDNIFELYCKNLKETGEMDVKIDDDVISYQLASDNKVIYETSKHNLYIHDLENKNKVASEISWFDVSEDGRYLLWYIYDNERYFLYYQEASMKASPQFLVEADSLEGFDSSMKKIYYVDNGGLYQMTDFKNPQLIDSEIEACWMNYDLNGPLPCQAFYYTKAVQQTASYMSYVEDDYAVEDAEIVCPVEDDYKKSEVITEHGISKRVNSLSDEYWEDKQKYEDKMARDEIRAQLSSESCTLNVFDLYYYDGSKSVKVLEQCRGWRYPISETLSTIVSQMDGLPEKINFSEVLMDTYGNLCDAAGVMELLEERLGSQKNRYVLLSPQKNQPIDLDAEFSGYFYINNAQEKFLASESGILKSISFSKDDFGTVQVEDENVSGLFALTSDGTFYYKGEDLYNDRKMIGYDISWKSDVDPENNLAFIADVNSDGAGTLMEYDGKDSVKIADDVWDYVQISNGKYVLITDYKSSSGRGNLSYYNGKKLIKLDVGVTALFK